MYQMISDVYLVCIYSVSVRIVHMIFDVSQKYHDLYHVRITFVSHTRRYRSDSNDTDMIHTDMVMIHTVGYGVFTVSYPLDTITIR